uniref:Binding protein n=1 Tax=Solanum tuberosum TaxID=4113 RepID=M1CGK4_SOLTU
MEHLLRSNLETNDNNNPQAILQALSLISNPSTSDSTLSSIAKVLIISLKCPNPNSNSHRFIHHHILRLFSLLLYHCPHLHHNLISAIREFSLLPSTSTRLLVDALTCLSISDSNVNDESTFLSLVFRPCVSVRHWLLLNVSKFDIRPSVLLTVLLGFTKDPYPCIRNVALSGLADLCKCIVVEDESLIKGCYFRAVELLFDSEDLVRCSAVHAVGACGQLIVASKQESKGDWSDALFLQLCSMVRDMSVKVRVEAFNALGKIETVSEYILLQTLSKKASSITKEMNFPGQYSETLFRIPAESAVLAFLHGLEDEFDVFLGILLDSHSLIRCRARKVLKLTELPSLGMFKMCVDGLIRDLELYPQDEAEVFSALFMIGQNHGEFLVRLINEASQMIEPSSGGKLGYDNVRKASYLVLATSAPVSMKQQTCSIPPRMFSYAVTLLGRISRSFADIVDQRTLLAYLSCCSRFTFVTASEFFKMEEHRLLPHQNNKMEEHLEEGDVQLTQRREISEYDIWRKLQLKEAESSLLDFQEFEGRIGNEIKSQS